LWVGVAGQDPRVAKEGAGVKGVGDRRMPQTVGADVPGMPVVFAIRATFRCTSRRKVLKG
jgi:hypothetical protein